MTLKSRIMKAGELSEMARFSKTSSSAPWAYTAEGMENENARLRPLLLALAEAMDAMDQMIARYEDAEARNSDATILMRGMSLGVYRALVEQRDALDEKLKEMGV